MLVKTKTISANGRSTVTVDGVETVAMTMNASINEDGSMSVNKYIQNKEVYKANKAACDADYEEFETYVDGLMEA